MLDSRFTVTAEFGRLVVRAWITGGRFIINPLPLDLIHDPHSIKLFRDAAWKLEEVTGWNCNGGQSNLVAALSADWEPAHIFVAMNLKRMEAYAKGEWTSFRDAGDCLWDVMRMMYSQSKSQS